MDIKTIVGILISILLLGGCNTNPAQQALLKKENQLVEDCKALKASPTLDPLRSKLPIGINPVPTRFVLIEDKVSQADKSTLLKYADITDSCAQMAFDYMLETQQMWLMPPFTKMRERSLTAFSELYGGRISYGEFNRLSAQSQAMYYEQWQELRVQQARLGLAAQSNQLQASRNLLFTAQQLSAPQPQLQRGMTHTNCQWFGQQMRCTSF